MTTKKTNYPFIASLIVALCALIIVLTEKDRVSPDHRSLYIALKLGFATACAAFAIHFRKHPFSDLAGGLLVATLISYCLTFMWFAPMYEAAYFQCVIGCSFFKFRRPWLFPLLSLSGLAGILITYVIQDQMQWTLPPADRMDWVWITSICSILSVVIHRFVVVVDRRERDQNARFGMIGRESSRLMHDIKGYLSSPLMIIEDLKSRTTTLKPEDIERQMLELSHEMEKVRSVLRSINRMVAVPGPRQASSITDSIEVVRKILERRLRAIEVIIPDDRKVIASPDLLHSTFFNLMLNSIEAFETTGTRTSSPRIEIKWNGERLVFSDNAGGVQPSQRPKAAGSGLGLELIRNDIETMGGKLHWISDPTGVRAEIEFAPEAN